MVSLCTAILAHAGAVGVSAQPLDPANSPTIHGLFLRGVLAFTGFIGFEAAAVRGEGAVKRFGRVFVGGHGEDGTTRQVLSAATGLPEVHRRG